MNSLSGYRTYASVVIGIIATGAFYLGYIDQKTFELIATFAGMAGLGFARAAIGKTSALPPTLDQTQR